MSYMLLFAGMCYKCDTLLYSWCDYLLLKIGHMISLTFDLNTKSQNEEVVRPEKLWP